MQKISVTHINNNHNDWLRGLDFYKQDIYILQGRLSEIASKNTAHEVQQQVEHFQNQFTVQLERIQELAHKITKNIAEISREAHTQSAHYVDGLLLANHNELELAYANEERIIKSLRHDFNKFAVKYM